MIEMLLRLLLLELLWLKLWVMAPILLLLWSTQLTSRHLPLPLFLIGFSNSLHNPLLVDGCTHQLIVRQAEEMYQALLQMDGEPCTVQVGLLFIHVDMVCAILSQGVKLPHVVE
jgi:hypothetical protein